jgi:hypothetical protein
LLAVKPLTKRKKIVGASQNKKVKIIFQRKFSFLSFFVQMHFKSDFSRKRKKNTQSFFDREQEKKFIQIYENFLNVTKKVK